MQNLIICKTNVDLYFYCSVLSAQNKGVVMDGISKNLLAGVNIYLNNKKVISKTNERGEFIIKN